MKNKRGFLPALFTIPGIVVILILVVATALLVTKVIEYKFIILGSAMLILSLVYGLKQGFDKTSGKIVLIFAGIGLVLIVLASTGVIQQQYDFSANAYYLPNYITIGCGVTGKQTQGSFTVDDVSSSTCGYSNDGPNAIPMDVFDGCDYTSKATHPIKVQIHEPRFDCDNIGFWSWAGSDSIAKNNDVHVPFGKKLCINENDWGHPTVNYRATKYGLIIYSGTGKVIFEKNCNLYDNYNKIAGIDYISGVSTKPFKMDPDDKAIYWIDGYEQRIAPLDVVNYNGKKIYITGIGSYYPIVTSNDGIKYANSLNEKYDNKIICVPSRNLKCVGGTKIIEDIEERDCSMFDMPEGYVVQPDGTECDYKCSNGNLKKDNCRKIAICSGDTPYRNPITNKCETNNALYDTNKTCGFGQHVVVKNEVSRSWYNYFGLGQPEVTAYETCETDGWVIYTIFGAVILISILGGMIIFKNDLTKRRIKR